MKTTGKKMKCSCHGKERMIVKNHPRLGKLCFEGNEERKTKFKNKKPAPEWLQRIQADSTNGMKPVLKEKAKGTNEGTIIKASEFQPTKNTFTNGSFQNVQRGEYECSKGAVYFRSKWEANYALYLDFLIKTKQIKNWEYESEVFVFEKINFGTKRYCPDFKVFNTDDSIEYHEVKGYMDAKSKTKLRRMEKYFPEISLILIDGKFYRDMMKKLKGIIKFY